MNKNWYINYNYIDFIIAGRTLCLDDIEHGLLRHSKWKYGMGYI